MEKNSKTKHLHCMLHRYALACKTLPPELRLVLDDVVHMINTIKSSSERVRRNIAMLKKHELLKKYRALPRCCR